MKLRTSLKDVIRRHARMAAYAVIALGFMGYIFSAAALFFPQVFNVLNRESLYTSPTLDARDPLADSYFLTKSSPKQLRIPSIKVDVPFSAPLGLKEGGEVEVPKEFDHVGWYKYGPTPGSLGPAVIFGHVDSKAGPAIFFSLGQVKVGDSVFVDREDGTTAEFEILGLERYPQNDFPTNKVYGNLPYAGLRLITCTGTYDKGHLRYTHNLVVYAKLKHSKEGTASGTASQ